MPTKRKLHLKNRPGFVEIFFDVDDAILIPSPLVGVLEAMGLITKCTCDRKMYHVLVRTRMIVPEELLEMLKRFQLIELIRPRSERVRWPVDGVIADLRWYRCDNDFTVSDIVDQYCANNDLMVGYMWAGGKKRRRKRDYYQQFRSPRSRPQGDPE